MTPLGRIPVPGVARRLLGVFLPVVLSWGAFAQQEHHGRGYKPLPPTANVQVTVEKAANEKPLANASVIFRASRNDAVVANLEMKTDPDGRASLDLLEVGDHITVQVIAGGFATYASDFDLSKDGKEILVKLQRPKSQVSMYGDGVERPSQVQPGVQEHHVPTPAGAGSGGDALHGANGSQAVPPGQGTPPVPVPGAAPGSATTPVTPPTPQGTPQ